VAQLFATLFAASDGVSLVAFVLQDSRKVLADQRLVVNDQNLSGL